MEPTDADEPEGESTEEEEKEKEEDSEEEEEDRSNSDAEDVEEIASRENGGDRVEGFLSALSKETLKPRKKVGSSFVWSLAFTLGEV